jgi:hypothetical protein
VGSDFSLMWFRRLLIILGYVFLTGALAVGTFALVAYGNDYSYDFKTHKIIQNGHVIIGSYPNGIRVTADGKELKKKTPYQQAYKVGLHTFALKRDGYYDWKKTLQVIAGQVSLVRYAVMVPKSPKVTQLDSRAQIVAQSISKDHRHLAYITGGADAGVYTLDVGNPKPQRVFAVPAVAEGVAPEVLDDVIWSDDASHVLVVTTSGTAVTHRLMTAAGGDVVNLTTTYGFTLSGLKFSAGNWRLLYWIAPDGLRRLDVGSQTVSAVLADQVTQFWIEQDRVLYVQQTQLGRSLWSLDGSGHHQELIQVLPESDSYAVDFVSYRGQDQLAVVPAKTQTATLYTGIFGDTPTAQVIAHNVLTANFSPDGHLLVLTAPNVFVTYDLEQSLVYQKPISYMVTDQPGKLLAMSWFDNEHLLANRDGKLYWSEFDGANLVDLGPMYGAFPAYGTADERSIVMFRPEGQIVRVAQMLIRQ